MMRIQGLHAPIVIAVLAAATAAGTVEGCNGELPASQAPVVQVEPLYLEFPYVAAGRSERKSFTIRSTGGIALQVLDVTMESSDEESLHLDRDVPRFPYVLAPMKELAIFVEYAPRQAGAAAPTGTVTVRTNDSLRPTVTVRVSTRATTAVLRIEPGVLTWRDVPVTNGQGCSVPGVQEFEIKNVGNDVLVITGHRLQALEGTSDPDEHFSVCPTSTRIGAGRSVRWKVAFHPHTAGAKRAKVVVESTGGTGEVLLQGNGSGSGGIEVTPLSLFFPPGEQGSRTDLNVTITNTGNVPVTVGPLALDPQGVRDYYSLASREIRVDEPSTIDVGQSATVRVTYWQMEPEPVEGKLLIPHDVEGVPSPIEVELKGNSPSPRLLYEPAFLRFGGVEPGEARRYGVVVRNGGSSELIISRLEIVPSGGMPGWENFRFLPQNFQVTLPPGPDARASFDVEYSRPVTGRGQDQACLRIYSNDPALTEPPCLQLFADNQGGNLPPVARIDVTPGDTVQVGQEVTFDGSDSFDPDEGQSIAEYEWLLVGWPPASRANLAGSTTVRARLVPDIPGRYEVSLVVTDSSPARFTSPRAVVTITARQDN